jgi:hypothetical protein
LPFGITGSVGAFSKGVAFICGGARDRCYDFQKNFRRMIFQKIGVFDSNKR